MLLDKARPWLGSEDELGRYSPIKETRMEEVEKENILAGGRLRTWFKAEQYFEEEERTLEETYWLFNEPNIPNMATRAGDFLKNLYDTYGVKPVVIDNEDRIFEARYEIAKYGEELTYKEAILFPNAVAFMDFLSGVPYGAVEMKARLWEISTKEAINYPTLTDPGAPVAPIPDDFFDEKFRGADTLFNYLFLDSDYVDAFIEGLAGEQETELLWWTRNNMVLPDEDDDPRQFPTPGEFMALGIRMFPDKPWGDQSTSPYLFSGNWFDTLYYTSAIVEEIIEPTEDIPFRLYKVKWRGKEEEMSDPDYNKFYARPSGFEEYKVDDRVTICKDATTERKSQTWKDDQEFLENIWRIVPVTFYEVED